MAGCSICWFNTVCYVLCIRNFPTHKALALSLTISFNGVSATLYTLIANSINPTDDTLYLISNALVPLFVSGAAVLPILRQPPPQQLSTDTIHCDFTIFLVLNIIAIATGLYLLLLSSLSSVASRARILLGFAILLLVLPLCLPGIVYARDWARHKINTSFHFRSCFNLDDTNDPELFKELIGGENATELTSNGHGVVERGGCLSCFGTFWEVVEKNRLTMLGEEHTVRLLVRKWDFWLYYFAYFCGGTIGIVYSNNLGQIAQSLGYESKLNSFIMLYSICSFFGRLLSAAPDFLCEYVFTVKSKYIRCVTLVYKSVMHDIAS